MIRKSSNNKKQINVIHYDLTGVYNQFNIKGGRRACIPISILTLYHLYRRIKLDSDNFILKTEEWNGLLKRGVVLYEAWVEMYFSDNKTKSDYDNKDITIFPALDEVLIMEECKSFRELFTSKEGLLETIEVSGLVRYTKAIENIEGTLLGLFRRIKDETKKINTPVCALVVIPTNICVSVICKREYKKVTDTNTTINKDDSNDDYSFLIFDSHGGRGKDSMYCELTQFFEPIDATLYLIDKYNIDSISQIEPQYLSLCTEEEIVSNYGFHSKIFK